MLDWFTPYAFLGAAQRKLLRQGAPVLMYHKIAAPPRRSRDPFLYASPADFEAQLGELQRADFASARLQDLFAPAASPGAPARVAITFDDGFVNTLEHGVPAMARQGVCALQYIVAGFLGRTNEWDVAKGDVAEPLMDAAQIRDWLAAGHEIGSHSLTHRNLRHLSQAEAREEIHASKRRLEDQFGVAVRHFSYPFGSWNPAVRDLVIEAGYQTACTADFGVNRAETPRYELRRIIPLSNRALRAKILHRLGRKLRGARP